MSRKAPGSIVFDLQTEGSVGVVVVPADRRRKTFFPVGYVRASDDGGFLTSTTFEEMQRYEEWGRHGSVEDALSSLISWEIGRVEQNGESGEEEVGKRASLQRAAHLVHESLPKTKKALSSAASRLVTSAVENMLRVATYDEVMEAVHRAIMKEVIGS